MAIANIRQWGDYALMQPLKAHSRRVVKAKNLSLQKLSAGLIDADIVAVLVVKDEAPRLPFLLEYYRSLGVTQFVFVDNESSDGTAALLLAEDGVTLYRASGSFRKARFGYDWTNQVLRWHGAGKWILCIDADELLVFAGDGDLRDLCRALHERRLVSMNALLLDMYSARPNRENLVSVGQNPLEVCNRFDGYGYEGRLDVVSGTTWIKGGVRGRLFFPNRRQGPALNKTPLVFWRKHYVYLRATHLAWPRRLNAMIPGSLPLGALLHFKFTSLAIEKIADSKTSQQHTDEYRAYGDLDDVTMSGDRTATFRTVRDLVECNLICDDLRNKS